MRSLKRAPKSIVRLQLFAVVSAAVIFALAGLSRISVDFGSFAYFLAAPPCIAACAIYLRSRGDQYLAPILETVSAGLFLVLPILISTYLAMSVGMPLADDQLLIADRILGFDWTALILWLDTQPTLARLLMSAYTSFEIQLLVVPILLCLFRQTDRAAAFVAGYGILCFLSSFIAIGYPSLGMYALNSIDQNQLQNINVHFGYHFLESFHAARSGAGFELSLGATSGIVTFPSVHAGIAFLIIWAVWKLKLLWIPFLVLNILMTISAITHGSHYLVDIIAALGVAGITISLIEWIFLENRPSIEPALQEQIGNST